MIAIVLLQLVFTAIPSILASNQVYIVTPDRSCLPDHECHNLSHYVAQSNIYFTSNTTFIFLRGEHHLDRQETIIVAGVDNLILEGRGDWVMGPGETVMQSTAVINCTRGRGGFSFINSVSVTMQGLTLVNCGTDGPFQIPKAYQVMNKTAIFLMNTQSFKFSQNSIQNNTGYGILVWECEHVEILNSSFFNSNQNKHSNMSSSSSCYYGDGGGAGLYTGSSNAIKIVISDSNFTRCCSWSTKGGGLSIGSTGNVSGSLTNLIFRKNRAILGGSGLAVVFTDGLNLLNISKSLFTEGEGTGLVFYSSEPAVVNMIIQDTALVNNVYSNSVTEMFIFCGTRNGVYFRMINSLISHTDKRLSQSAVWIRRCRHVVLEKVTMHLQNNQVGGFLADGLYRLFGFTMPKIDIQSCVFEQSINSRSVAIFNDINVRIGNSIFRNNTQGRSVVTISVGSQMHVWIIFTTISNNGMTGLTILSGPVTFLGNNTIENNNAIQGGAINLLELSVFAVFGTLTLHNNTAGTFGGAIYQSSGSNLPTVEMGNNVSLCTLFPVANSLIIFSGNRAAKGGSDIYGTRLMDCYFYYNQYIPRIGRPNETSWYFDTPFKRHFQFVNSDQLSSMTSNPIMVCFCNNSNLPDCSDRVHHLRTYPGLDFDTTIATVGYYGGTSPGVVTADVLNATLVRYYGQKETTKCFTVHFLLQSSDPALAQVDIRVNGGLLEWGVSLEVEIEDCPVGFYKSNSSGHCECLPLLTPDVTCNVSRKPFQFLRSGNTWFAYINNTKCITAASCPFDYCNLSLVEFDMTRPNYQCVANRTGILCGQCYDGQSLMLGSNRCSNCSNFYLLLLPVFALAGMLLVAIVMFLNLTVSVGTINGLLFYANMIKLNVAIFLPGDSSLPVVSQFISWLNLDLGIEVCLFDGLDGYWKTWLQFVFPAYLFLLMGGIIVGCHYSVWLCRLCGSHAVPALATLFLMSYTKILLTVTNALSMSQLPCNDSVLTVWSVDANISYGSGKHLPLVIFSCIVLVIGLVYPVLLLCAPLLERYSHKCLPHKWNPVPSLKPLLDAYGGPYKDNYRFWTGVTLVLRLICTIIFSFVYDTTSLVNAYVINTIILGILTAWAFMSAVYRNVALSILEVFFLINLFLVTNVSPLTILIKNFQKTATIILIGSSMICFFIIVIGHCLTQTKFKKYLASTSKPRAREVPQLATAEDDNGRKRVSGSPPLHVYGTERGLHRFVLKFPRQFDKDKDSAELSSPVLMEREPLLHHDDQYD